MPLPGGEPVKRLERGAVGGAFEAAPFGFDGVQIAVDAEIQARRAFAQHVATARALPRGGRRPQRSRFEMPSVSWRASQHSLKKCPDIVW